MPLNVFVAPLAAVLLLFAGCAQRHRTRAQAIEASGGIHGRPLKLIVREEPGFGAVHAYEALMVVAEAARKSPRLDPIDIKRAIITIGRFKGLQTDILIDANGDCSRPHRDVEARRGAFVPANEG